MEGMLKVMFQSTNITMCHLSAVLQWSRITKNQIQQTTPPPPKKIIKKKSLVMKVDLLDSPAQLSVYYESKLLPCSLQKT